MIYDILGPRKIILHVIIEKFNDPTLAGFL